LCPKFAGRFLFSFPQSGTTYGMLYVNTTTASPDTIKYSRQIDVNSRIANII